MSQVKTTFKVKKTKLGKYPYFSVIFSSTLALFVVGIFFSLIIYSRELEKVVREGVNVQVFLQNHITKAHRMKIYNALSTKYYTLHDKTEHRDSATQHAVQFISKEEASKQFIDETGEDFQQLLGKNPLRDAFLVRIAANYQNAKSLAKIKVDIEKINGVFMAYYVENMIESINKNLTKISLILLGTGLMLFFISALLINNAVRLALFSQRFIIRSMQLVGATSWFIQRSFLKRGLINGLSAGLIASFLLFEVIDTVNQKIDGLLLIYNQEKIIFLLLGLILLGLLVPILSTFKTVNKFLHLSLDEFY